MLQRLFEKRAVQLSVICQAPSLSYKPNLRTMADICRLILLPRRRDLLCALDEQEGHLLCSWTRRKLPTFLAELAEPVIDTSLLGRDPTWQAWDQMWRDAEQHREKVSLSSGYDNNCETDYSTTLFQIVNSMHAAERWMKRREGWSGGWRVCCFLKYGIAMYGLSWRPASGFKSVALNLARAVDVAVSWVELPCPG